MIGIGASGSSLRSFQGLVKVKGSNPGVDSVGGNSEKFSIDSDDDDFFGTSKFGEKFGPEKFGSKLEKSSVWSEKQYCVRGGVGIARNYA